MKNLLKIVFLISIIIVSGIFVGCASNIRVFKLEYNSQSYMYGSFGSIPIDLPSVLEENDKTDKVVSNDRLLWSVSSGNTAKLVDNQQFVLENIDGDTVFKVVIDGEDKYSYYYTVNVESGFGSLGSSLENYNTKVGIAQKRVFGTKDVVDGHLTNASEIIYIKAESNEAIKDDYSIQVDESKLGYEWISDDSFRLIFKQAGQATLRVEYQVADDFGEYPFFAYVFNVIDGVNVYNVEQLDFVQGLVTHNDNNTYTYDGYTGVDGTNFETVVIRSDIMTNNGTILFYGSVHGNGYTLDATPIEYKDSDDVVTVDAKFDNSKVWGIGHFNLMSDNTVLNNVTLVGYNNNLGNLAGYADTGTVLAVYGIRNTVSNFDNITSSTRMAKNIKIVNSIIEKGHRGIFVSGAPDKGNPIVIESSVIRLTGDHGIWLETYWQRDDYVPNEDYNGDKEYKTFVTLRNIIMTDTKLPPIGISSNLDSSSLVPLADIASYGVQLNIEGQHNYIYNWLKFADMSYGELFPTINISDIIEEELNKNDELKNQLTYYYDDSENGDAGIYESSWFNLIIFGNYIFKEMIVGDSNEARETLQPNTVIIANDCNLKDVLLPETILRIKIIIITGMSFEVEASVHFASKDIVGNAPRPEDNLQEVVPQRIREITPVEL